MSTVAIVARATAAPTAAPSAETLAAWIEQFHRDGYLLVRGVLDREHIDALKTDLDRALEMKRPMDGCFDWGDICHRLFEVSGANRRLFDLEPIVSFAEAIVAADCHVIHNNSFRTRPGQKGISSWHQDDAPHFLVTHGEVPTNIRLPVLFFTANFYLTDVDAPTNGSMELVPGSHMNGVPCPADLRGTKWEKDIIPVIAKAGDVVLFNNQLWHRGRTNESERTRYITQLTYARRMIGHKYHPFMNYVMPEHVHAGANPRLKRLLGFLPHGAYG
ncbi:MAG: phytanoyl-CoA dioxygenase family protein [Planctomycetes bacterium]|nr:phytanoyl-CoA dioxygenase family protein [Planctomycetota bacterium]